MTCFGITQQGITGQGRRFRADFFAAMIGSLGSQKLHTHNYTDWMKVFKEHDSILNSQSFSIGTGSRVHHLYYLYEEITSAIAFSNAFLIQHYFTK